MIKVKIYGWTLPQWARACAVLRRKITSLEDGLDIRRDWMNKWNTEPTDVSLIVGVDRGMDYESARKLFTLTS